MPWWRKLLALLGLTEDARVRVRAPGIEVVITGDPEIAKNVLSVVKAEIARQSSRRRGESVMASPSRGGAAALPGPSNNASTAPPPGPAQQAAAGSPQSARAAGGGGGGGRSGKKKAGHSQVVRPTDLDEMDSPYAIPEHIPLEDVSETPAEGFAAERTLNVDGMIESARDDDEPEPEPTAVDVAGPQQSLPPTLIPEIAPSRAPSRVANPKVVVGRRMQDPTEPE